eukprot:jgi/Bigna1/58666/fgenesh1_kg.1_\
MGADIIMKTRYLVYNKYEVKYKERTCKSCILQDTYEVNKRKNDRLEIHTIIGIILEVARHLLWLLCTMATIKKCRDRNKAAWV